MMSKHLRKILETERIEASAPCRVDMGGTLDINTFYFPLRHLDPCTFNMAIDLRTRVCLRAHEAGWVKISSRGFKSAEYPLDKVPFDHPLGLMFAIAAYFGADGVHIDIESSSPPRSALGGSSVAGVALVAALSSVFQKSGLRPLMSMASIAMLAHALESSVAGVPCGFQDQLAAVYGGVNAWHWCGGITEPCYKKEVVIPSESFKDLEQRMLLAYCGVPHESKNINSRWVQQFLSGASRGLWVEIITCTKSFITSLAEGDYDRAAARMNQETAVRMKMTPDVLDDMGKTLVHCAVEQECGARFTGAGGGGCIWALGEAENISRLKNIWTEVLAARADARLLDVKIDSEGLRLGGDSKR